MDRLSLSHTQRCQIYGEVHAERDERGRALFGWLGQDLPACRAHTAVDIAVLSHLGGVCGVSGEGLEGVRP